MSYFNRGLAYYYYLGQHQRAIQDYDKAIQLDPNDAKAYNNRGFAYHNLGQDAEADADKAKACSLDSQYCSKPPPTHTPTPITLPPLLRHALGAMQLISYGPRFTRFALKLGWSATL